MQSKKKFSSKSNPSAKGKRKNSGYKKQGKALQKSNAKSTAKLSDINFKTLEKSKEITVPQKADFSSYAPHVWGFNDENYCTREVKDNTDIPELLSPAGSLSALYAAVYAGADAVYFGLPKFNARINADNISEENIESAVRFCHLMGAKAYITLNTQIYDKEYESFLETAKIAYNANTDAVITGDLGGAALLQKNFKDFPIHASTQLSGHNSNAGAELSKLGFSRMVLARELPLKDILSFTENSSIEAEIFVHGALCVCHSGQCLFSSLVGGRSGNRGMCAQPCRLPYSVSRYKSEGKIAGTNEDIYALSLKDSCLAKHIPKIIKSKVSSLKIEGRMKPADYVFRVTSVYRKLLDEVRGATCEEISYLSDVFSRNGFTDGYLTEHISRNMLGVRTKGDKEKSLQIKGDIPVRKVCIYVKAKIKENEKMELTLGLCQNERHRYKNLRKFEVTVYGDLPEKAINQPLSEETVQRNLSKFGNTVFKASEFNLELDENIMVPVSALNSLRRAGVSALENLILSPYKKREFTGSFEFKPTPVCEVNKKSKAKKIGIFSENIQISDMACEYFDELYLPLTEFIKKEQKKVSGVILPCVIFDSEIEKVRELLKIAKEKGAKSALCSNLGHIGLAKEFSLRLCGDFRLNISNTESFDSLNKFGFENAILSPELTAPKIKGIVAKAGTGIGKRAIIYGRIPLMVLEKCVICESFPNGNYELCPIKEKNENIICKGELKDRTDAVFPVIREFQHRNVIYNSVKTYMGDKASLIDSLDLEGEVFLFSDESREQVLKVIDDYKSQKEADGKIRRLGVNM